MFFHTYILTRRGPFAKIWLAAHWDRKLTKNDVKVIDLSQTVVQIIEPSVPIALRTSGELMLGVVRVYGHKVRILLKEVHEITTELLRPITLKDATTGKDVTLMVPATGIKTAKDNAAHVTISGSGDADKDHLTAPAGFATALDTEFDAIAGFVGLGATPHDSFFTSLKAGGGNNKKGVAGVGKDDDMLAEEWFQPQTSQFQEGLRAMSQEEVDALRAELAGGVGFSSKRGREESVPLSERSKKSGATTTSSTSVEQLRASGRHSRGGEVDLLMDLPNNAEAFVEDAFLGHPADPTVPEEAPVARGLFDELEGAEPLDSTRPSKKAKVLNIVDASNTTISTAAYTKPTESQMLRCAAARHGARTEADAYRLQHMHDAFPLGLLGCDVESATPWTIMQDTFAAAVRSGRTMHTAAPEAPRASKGGAEEGHDVLPDMFDAGAMPPAPEMVDHDGMMMGMPAPGEEDFNNVNNNATNSVAANKEHLDKTLGLLQANANTKKVAVFRSMMKGKHRLDVARAFADILVLTSQTAVSVKQEKPFGEIFVTVK